MNPQLAIVIPTHKRPDALKTCLEHLAKQTIANELEVIVVNDADDPTTDEICNARITHHALPITHYLKTPPCQQGAARNQALKKVTAPFTLFIGDDIFLAPEAAAAHLAIHHVNQAPQTAHHSQIAVLGFTTWDPTLKITPVMRWLEESGWQFGYPLIKKYAMQFIPSAKQPRFTYTSHLSLPTKLARQFPFKEDVSLYGWEDIEWGERLAQAGIRLFYCDVAQAHHHHHITLEQSLKRMETLGESIQKYKKSDRYPKWYKRLAYRILIWLNPGSLASRHRKAFLRGLNKKDLRDLKD